MSDPALHTRRPLHAAWAAALALVAVLAFSACGGGGVVPTPGVQNRPLSADFTSRKAVAYSPFRTGNRDTEIITAAMIREDLALLAQGGFTLLRIFDSSDAVARLLLQVIKDDQLPFKVMLGVYLVSESSPNLSAAVKAANRSLNLAEVARGIALAKQFSDIVVAVSVGNETLVTWSFVPSSPAIVAAHIKSVRDQITQPVTTDDNWAFFAKAPGEPNDPREVIEAIDFVSLHTYPLADSLYNLYDWQQQAVPEAGRAAAMMEASFAKAKSDYDAVRKHLDDIGQAAKPIVIGETGWKAVASNNEFNRAHPVNQQMYFAKLTEWIAAGKAGKGPTAIFYFEAFDEPWKGGDDKWGLFNVNRQARYAIQGLYPKDQYAWASEDPAVCKLPLACAASDAVYAPTITSGTISADRYTLYADAVTAGEVRVSGLQWLGWDSPPNAFAGEGSDAALAAEGPHFMEIAPAPPAANPYGWGLFTTYSASTDLSQFEATGRLNFSIKTTYAGKLRVGFLCGSGASSYDVFLPIASGQYGYVNDGQWHAVSIPISAIKAAGAPSYGTTAPTSKFDLTKVTNPFVINDIYGITGNAAGSTTKIYIDNLFWSK